MNQESISKCSQKRLGTIGSNHVDRNPPVSWMHTIPSYMPWSVPQVCLPNSEVMQFTGEPSLFLKTSSLVSTQSNVCEVVTEMDCISRPHYKRKGAHLDGDLPFANKVYISEEGMIARMSDLNISNNNMASLSDNASCTNENSVLKSSTYDEHGSLCGESNRLSRTHQTSHQPVLVLAPELRKLQKTDAIIPSSILKTLKKPSMELVLWKPPGGVVDEIIKNAAAGCRTDDSVKSNVPSNSQSQRQRVDPSTNMHSSPEQMVSRSCTTSCGLTEDETMDVT